MAGRDPREERRAILGVPHLDRLALPLRWVGPGFETLAGAAATALPGSSFCLAGLSPRLLCPSLLSRCLLSVHCGPWSCTARHVVRGAGAGRRTVPPWVREARDEANVPVAVALGRRRAGSSRLLNSGGISPSHGRCATPRPVESAVRELREKPRTHAACASTMCSWYSVSTRKIRGSVSVSLSSPPRVLAACTSSARQPLLQQSRPHRRGAGRPSARAPSRRSGTHAAGTASRSESHSVISSRPASVIP